LTLFAESVDESFDVGPEGESQDVHVSLVQLFWQSVPQVKADVGDLVVGMAATLNNKEFQITVWTEKFLSPSRMTLSTKNVNVIGKWPHQLKMLTITGEILSVSFYVTKNVITASTASKIGIAKWVLGDGELKNKIDIFNN